MAVQHSKQDKETFFFLCKNKKSMANPVTLGTKKKTPSYLCSSALHGPRWHVFLPTDLKQAALNPTAKKRAI